MFGTDFLYMPCMEDKEHYLNVNFSKPVIVEFFSLGLCDET